MLNLTLEQLKSLAFSQQFKILKMKEVGIVSPLEIQAELDICIQINKAISKLESEAA